MIRLRRECRQIILPLIILIFLLTLTLKIQKNTRPPEPLVIISSANQLTELTTLPLNNVTTFNSFSSLNVSVKNGINYSNYVTEQIPNEPPPEKNVANQHILYQAIWNCLCSRRFMYPPSSQNHTHSSFKLNSSCSDEGTHYQPNQNVISMSMFLSSRPSHPKHTSSSYQIGLVRNLIQMRKKYPSYSLRIYTNIPLVANSYWCKVLCRNPDLFWCDIRRTPSHGNLNGMNLRTWRFLVLGDPTVQVFQSRDLDSLISHREAAAVQDWLENVGYKAFMLMRDKKYYHNTPILAGMWGAQNNRLEEKGKLGTLLRERIIKLSSLKKNRESKPFDQRMLGGLIVGEHGRDVVAYDSYHCKQWAKKTMVRPYPTQRLEDIPERDFVANMRNFTGDGRGKNHNFKQKDLMCPVECRPSYGKDWKYC